PNLIRKIFLIQGLRSDRRIRTPSFPRPMNWSPSHRDWQKYASVVARAPGPRIPFALQGAGADQTMDFIELSRGTWRRSRESIATSGQRTERSRMLALGPGFSANCSARVLENGKATR